jgi:UDPglucose 6-dehydrogenase
MKIAVIGTGYVGSVTGACFAEMGHNVIFVGRDPKKLDLIKAGKSPIFEPGMDQLLQNNRSKISTTRDIRSAVRNSDMTFICVGTPPQHDGSSDLSQVREVSGVVGSSLANLDRYHLVVTKSTVLPWTNEQIIIPILEKESGKRCFKDFGVASNPEFLKEGSAVKDFFQTDRVVIGAHDQDARELLENLYRPLHAPIFMTDIRTAEMIKFVSNAFLATKISFANEIGNLCKATGIDSYEVFGGVGMDTRINPHFFRSGIGFGGSCFPKDVQALIAYAKSFGMDPQIMEAVISTNDRQPRNLVTLLKKHLDIRGKTIGLLGLAFKPDTDDIRESRAIPIVRELLKEGAMIIAYDPVAMPAFSSLFPDIRYVDTAKETCESDAVVIVTEWDEFSHLNYNGKIVIDGRRILKAREEALVYEGVCW